MLLEKKHQGEMLRDALTKLSPEHREIIDLVYYTRSRWRTPQNPQHSPCHGEDPHVLRPEEAR